LDRDFSCYWIDDETLALLVYDGRQPKSAPGFCDRKTGKKNFQPITDGTGLK